MYRAGIAADGAVQFPRVDHYINPTVMGRIICAKHARQQPQKHPWVMRLLAKKPAKLVAVPVANKMARVAWAIMAKGGNTIERRRSLQPPEEARQWEPEAILEQDNRIARVMMA